jgi:hypothetical protein
MNDAGTHEILLSHGGTYVTMLEHNPASGSMPPSAENNQTVNMSASGLAWYLIRTKSGKEQYVHRELSRRLPDLLAAEMRH